MQTQIKELAPGLELGFVRWFDNRPEKQFGFITKTIGGPKEEEIFFHRNDWKFATVSENGLLKDFPIFNDRLQISPVLGKPPQPGQVVVFKTTPAMKGPKASPWTTWEEYQKAYLRLHQVPQYRVVGKYPHTRREGHGTAIFDAGLSMEFFYWRYPDCQENLTNIWHHHKLPNYIDEAWVEVLPVGKNEFCNGDWQRVDSAITPKKVVGSKLPKLKITAIYDVGGHQGEYVVQLWTLRREHNGMEDYEQIDFPPEFSKIFEEVFRSDPMCWYVCDRGSRIEVNHFAQTRASRNLAGSHGCIGFSSDHLECKRLIEDALRKMESKLKEIRETNDPEKKLWAQYNVSPLLRERYYTFHVEKIEVR